MKILKDGYCFIVAPIFIIFILFFICAYNLLFVIIFFLCVIISLFFVYFFRDPKVEIISGHNLIVSPCNGTVIEIKYTSTEKIIRVFLSIFDVHLQRSPVSGKVVKIDHKYGKFLNAINKNAHILNEQNIVVIEDNNCNKYIIKQIAGFFARRCVLWIKNGDILNSGDKIGMIKFGSQVDLHMPYDVDVKVKKGDKVISGITVFAILN
jgi:phosphatidylserine decarboxylase